MMSEKSIGETGKSEANMSETSVGDTSKTREKVIFIPASDRHFSNFGWLKTYWLFSFSDYYDPVNVKWGSLRVFNDDVVEGKEGFPTHPHREMEIVSIVLEGALSHKDSTGRTGQIVPGDVQRMSAGTGITHSEYNHEDEPVHFYQIWIEPGVPQLEPSYEQKHYEPHLWRNNLLAIASGEGIPGTVTLHTNATIYRSHLDEGREVTLGNAAGRRVFIYVTSGSLEVLGRRVSEQDQLRFITTETLKIIALEEVSFILIDAPEEAGPPKELQSVE